MAAAAIVLLAAGLLLGYPEVTAVGLASGFTVAGALAWLVVRPVVRPTRTLHPPQVTQGEPATALIQVTNTGQRVTPTLLLSEQLPGGAREVHVPGLAPDECHTTSVPLPTNRRGVITVGPLRLGQTDPLRLAERMRSAVPAADLLVHPRVHRVHPPGTSQAPDADGAAGNNAPRSGAEFHSLREYLRGDPFHLISWKATARYGKLMVRQNTITIQPRTLVLLDTSTDPYTGDSFEDAVRVAASLAVASWAAGHRVDLSTTDGGRISPKSGTAGRTAILDFLTHVQPRPDHPGLTTLPTVARSTSTTVVAVTGRLDSTARTAVSAARARFQRLHLVQIADSRRTETVPGVATITADTSESFAVAWNNGEHR